ncbi:MAG: cytochrome P450 [Pseudomonadales bacterium]|jgi:linalool 8-monooxygenase|nr:cytochrome P450 [Pseudomonadales bacterium]MDP7359780.1 cytochrome P450 [Pseudomonadales bacterium]MDP7597008.1 cytochrome P450 [Pseudomonadales bacterium]HJN52211.1 cytochrome P450 [Pseudomonadales bacterium]|tara:strand:+ start:2638 stop:3915 length:1278 start_codon:yes stop_codon:yes gene_type:complete
MAITPEERLSLSYSETFQDHRNVHGIFTRMRAEKPVAWCPEPWGGPGFWSITKYDDIQFVSKNPTLFSSDQKLGGITLPSNEMIRNRRKSEGREILKEAPQEFSQFQGGSSMITMDPPAHVQSRRVVAPGFTPQKLDDLTPRIRKRAREILNRIEGEDDIEFIQTVAAELPIQMLAELFDIDQDVRHKLFEWSNIIIGGDDPDIVLSAEQVRTAFIELGTFAMQTYEKRKQEPGEDLISMLVHTEVNGSPMSIGDYLSAMILLVVAGNETTRNSISGGVLALSQNPRERQKLLDDPALISSAVDEIIRWVHPVIYMRRTVKEDSLIGGQAVKKGDKLALWYMSGNRDEEKWDESFTFDVSRKGPRHLSFGYGEHLCIGWRLAEIQLTVIMEELLARFPNITVVGDVNRMRSNFLNSIKTMQVSLQ